MIDAVHERLDEEVTGQQFPWITLIIVALLFWFGIAAIGASIAARFGPAKAGAGFNLG